MIFQTDNVSLQVWSEELHTYNIVMFDCDLKETHQILQ